MATPDRLARVQEALLELEMRRLYDITEVDEEEQRAAVRAVVAWLQRLWHEDRGFLTLTALPLVAFRAFQEAATRDRNAQEQPLVVLLRRMSESASSEASSECVVRHVANEYRVFATVLGHDDASADGLTRVTECFLAAVGRQALCVETIGSVLVDQTMTGLAKKTLLRFVEGSARLTPDQKIAILLHVCEHEATANARELAVKLIEPYAAQLTSTKSVLPLLADKSQKVRRVAASCIMKIGMDCLREDLDDYAAAEVIVNMDHVSGSSEEKRFVRFVGDYFANATTLDEMCELSILLDDAGASPHPVMAKVLPHALGSRLNPSFFAISNFSQRTESMPH